MQNIIAKVIEREGGDKLTKDPSDPGGTTKYGISQRANPDVDIENLRWSYWSEDFSSSTKPRVEQIKIV